MRFLFFSFVAIQLAIASQASSSEIRIQNLAESRLLDRFSDFFGPCVRSLSSSRIVLTCITEGKQSQVWIDVVSLSGSGGYGSPQLEYIQSRKRYCFELASERRGRCISTEEIAPRVSLEGFSSKSVLDEGTYRSETVVFYGPELIRATSTTQLDNVGAGIDGLIQNSLARLTLLW